VNVNDLIYWYNLNARDLPWRQTKDPYKIWLSEIMLQQTRVNQALPYYIKFTEAFETVNQLAEAKEEEVLKLWQGLGYYSRARNLHACAKTVMEQHNGIFPNNFKDLLKLPGVGNYTAAAIASFCFNEKVPVIDGNVYRVISRIFGVETPINSPNAYKVFFEIANQLIKEVNPASFNQAIMEFGAIHCTPANPNCDSCIFKLNCFGFNHKQQTEFPKKVPKKARRKQTINYQVLVCKNDVLLRKRTENGIWKNLYDLPENLILSVEPLKSFGPIKHQLTHIEIEANFIYFELEKKEAIQLNDNYEWISVSKLKEKPTSRLVENFFNSLW